jgi:hypothetical protein
MEKGMKTFVQVSAIVLGFAMLIETMGILFCMALN